MVEELVKNRKIELNRFALQIIAMVSMVTDHVAIMFLQSSIYYLPCRIVGRLAFPIIAFLLVEGYLHTANIKKYMLRIFFFAIVSEVPYQLAMNGNIISFEIHNTLWTLLVCLLTLALLDRMSGGNALIKKCVVVTAATALSILLKLDYGYIAVLTVVLIRILKENKAYVVLSIALLNVLYGGAQMYGAAAALPVALYNGKRGPLKIKYLFYVFYPVHLLLLWFVKIKCFL